MSFDSSTYTSRGRFKRTKFVPSSVDEALFGELRKSREPDPDPAPAPAPEFEPPWVDTGKAEVRSPPKPLLFYCPNASSTSSFRPSSASSRTSSRLSRTPNRTYKPVKFSPTVIDNTLFGGKKKEQLHSLQTDRFVTSMTRNEISFDGEVCNSYRPQSSICSSRTPSSNTRPKTPVKAKSSPPPWR